MIYYSSDTVIYVARGIWESLDIEIKFYNIVKENWCKTRQRLE